MALGNLYKYKCTGNMISEMLRAVIPMEMILLTKVNSMSPCATGKLYNYNAVDKWSVYLTATIIILCQDILYSSPNYLQTLKINKFTHI